VARKKSNRSGGEQMGLPMAPFEDASLSEETRKRYLNYALSVITSRALPDVRDGLKPVQRRILYTMLIELRLRHDVKYRKSAAIVGDVMGKFHPHGDTAIYDALARMAQSFSLRMPLVDGRGNFGSPDGDSPAAMRYTEARLHKVAEELLREIPKQTVQFRPNYDGTRFEPIVLPARFPNLLVNGSQGIAVGMATSIPPHNLGEVIGACTAMIDNPKIELDEVLDHVQGPDFPTAGQLICNADDLRRVYTQGQGSLRLRGEWEIEPRGRGADNIVVTSIPYAVERRAVVEKVAEVIMARKLDGLYDVRDESSDETRVVLELKRGADPQLVMAYLFKHTPLSTNIQFNLTCLVPTANPDVAAPQRLGLLQMLRQFLDFRMEVVTRRIEFDLAKLRERIHILEGLRSIFDALDETIKIIRASEGKRDAAERLMARFKLDELQVDAILELKLYRLAKLEILVIEEELGKKEKEAARLERLLKGQAPRWKLIRRELLELRDEFATERMTSIAGEVDEPEFEADAFIVDEDAMAVITQQGWVKRQQRVRDVSTTRVRDGDRVLDVVAGSTRSSVALFSSLGSCYVTRLVDIPATTGYGAPVQSLFKMKDGERIVAMMGFDPRFLDVAPPTEGSSEPEPPLAVAVTRGGMALRFSLRGHREPSTRNGRKFCRTKKGDEVICVSPVEADDKLACATVQGRALICSADDVSTLAGPGQGVKLIRLSPGDQVIGAAVLSDHDDVLLVKNQNDTEYRVSLRKYGVVTRGGKGHVMFKRGHLERVVVQEPTLPGFPAPEVK